jgi:hypothetical protein
MCIGAIIVFDVEYIPAFCKCQALMAAYFTPVTSIAFFKEILHFFTIYGVDVA